MEYARWCHSVHNLLRHKVKIISETEAELYYDPARLLPVADPKAVFVTIAMDIFFRTPVHRGWLDWCKSNYHRNRGPIATHATVPTLFAKLTPIPASEKENLEKELIIKRRTSRLTMTERSLKRIHPDKVEKQAEQFEHKFFSTSDKEIVDFIIDLISFSATPKKMLKPKRKDSGKVHGAFRLHDEISFYTLMPGCLPP